MIKLLIFFVFTLSFAFLITGRVLAQGSTVNATVRPNPLVVSLNTPSAITVREWFTITAEITNRGGNDLTRASVTLSTPKEMSVKGKRQNIKTLSANETETVTWRVKANSVGEFVVVAEVRGDLLGETITASSDSSLLSTFSSFAQRFFRLFFRA